MSIKKELQQIIKESLDKININLDESDIIIETPKDELHGNYSTNLSLILAKKLHKNPLEIANEIKNNINNKILEKIKKRLIR